jgi:hypothetical protein
LQFVIHVDAAIAGQPSKVAAYFLARNQEKINRLVAGGENLAL